MFLVLLNDLSTHVQCFSGQAQSTSMLTFRSAAQISENLMTVRGVQAMRLKILELFIILFYFCDFSDS